MFTTPDQVVAMHKAALESFQAVALKSVEGLEKLAELNMAAAKSTMEEGAEQMKAMLEVKDVKALADMAMGSASRLPTRPQLTRSTSTRSPAKPVPRSPSWSSASSPTATSSCTPQSTRWQRARRRQRRLGVVREAGGDRRQHGVRQVNKATKQVVEMTEANVAAAAKTAVNGGARSRKSV